MEIKSAFLRKRNNNYNVYIEYYDTTTGKLKQRSEGKYSNKKDAEKHLIEIKNSINKNSFIISKDITFIDRCYVYMDNNYKNCSPTTIDSRKSYIKNNIKPFFKNTKLKDVTPALLQHYISYLDNNHTLESLKVRYKFVKAVLREAYRLREIHENPCVFVKMPKLDKKEFVADVYDRDEVKLLIQSLENQPFEIPIMLMLTLGLRVGEVCGLRWEDIDFEKSTISINQILIYIPGQGILFKSPKTKGSIRTLTVPSEVMYKLEQWKILYDEFAETLEYKDIVCLNTTYLPYTQRTLLRAWYKFLDNIGLKRVRLHDLRHTNATMMLLSGTDMKTVSERLGHTDIKISINKYSHVLEEMDKKASENLSNIMFK